MQTLSFNARAAANVSCLAIDSAYKQAMSVVGQPPHGQPTENLDEVHVLTSVACVSGILVCKPKFSEHGNYQHETLISAVNPDRVSETRIIYTDNPTELATSTHALYRDFCNLQCIAKDPIHLVLSVEKFHKG